MCIALLWKKRIKKERPMTSKSVLLVIACSHDIGKWRRREG
jgi:hypothetical protein